MTTNSLVTTGRELAGYAVYKNAHCYDFTQPTIGQLYDYLFAANGIFLRARRPGLNVCFQIGDCELRGLATIEPFQRNFTRPRVPAAFVQKMLEMSIATCVDAGQSTEALFYLIWNEEENRWRLDKPAQEANGGSVRPLEDGEGSSYQLALIEVHSHHQMLAFFSGDDDADEQGFRIYAVIGEIFSEPKIRVRLGCFGHFHELRADTVFELPETITDNYEEEPPFVDESA